MRGNMSESAQLGKSVTPPEGAAVLAGDPLPGITAQGFADELGEDLSDHRLAEAISLAWAKVGNLMHLVEEDDALGSELDEWLDLERELCREALARDGATLREGLSLTELIAPFMRRNGYRDACGWWVSDEENAIPDVAGGICPECGAGLKGFVEGSSMGSRCPKCGWSVVTTFAPPIMEDERGYTIVLVPGGAASGEALRAVSRIAMCNFVEARRLIAGAPIELFTGFAAEVLTHKNNLEAAGVPIEVHPNFPYDEDGRLANEVRLNGLLLAKFPELKGKFEDYTSWQDGMETGCFLTYEDLLLPLTRQALDKRDEALLTRLGAFIEQLMTSGDDYAINVATVGLIEGLKAYGNQLVRSFLGPISLKEFDALIY